MKYLICYDIQEDKVRTKVFKLLKSCARRVQYSVFLGDFTDREAKALRQKLLSLTEESEQKMLMMAPLCKTCSAMIWKIGEYIDEPGCCIVA